MLAVTQERISEIASRSFWALTWSWRKRRDRTRPKCEGVDRMFTAPFHADHSGPSSPLHLVRVGLGHDPDDLRQSDEECSNGWSTELGKKPQATVEVFGGI